MLLALGERNPSPDGKQGPCTDEKDTSSVGSLDVVILTAGED